MPHLKRVLLTGAFGGLGRHVLRELLGRGYQVRCFDRPSRSARRFAGSFHRRLDLAWGDIRVPADLEKAVSGSDAVIHTAGVSYPASEADPAASAAVNVLGTRNLVDAVQRKSPQAQIVFASSFHVHPYRPDRGRLLHVGDPLGAGHPFGQQKIEAENAIRSSGLSFTILRLAEVLLDRWPTPRRIRAMFELPLDTRLELVHPTDAGVAFANALARPGARSRTFFVGGGKTCQVTVRTFYRDLFAVRGLAMPPDAAFSQEPFVGDWLDTTESHAVLTYQKRSLAEWLKARRPVPPLYWTTRLLSQPFLALTLRLSPPWRHQRLAAPAAAPGRAAEAE